MMAEHEAAIAVFLAALFMVPIEGALERLGLAVPRPLLGCFLGGVVVFAAFGAAFEGECERDCARRAKDGGSFGVSGD